MKVLIIALARTGSSNLLFKLAEKNNLKPIFEPFRGEIENEYFDGINRWVYNESEDNIVVKTIIHHHRDNLKLAEKFDKVILLSRRDLKQCAESTIYHFKNRTEGFKSWMEYYYEGISDEELQECLEFVKENHNQLVALSEKLGVPITYYEDLYDLNSPKRLRKFSKNEISKNKIL